MISHLLYWCSLGKLPYREKYEAQNRLQRAIKAKSVLYTYNNTETNNYGSFSEFS